MRLAVFLFHESRNPSLDGQVIFEAVREAQLAEEQGMDAVFLAEHHFDGNCVYVDPPTFASALAMVTNRIKIGFAVLQTSLYHPLRMAEQLSLIDNLEGRLIVGLGRGNLVSTHEYSGYELIRPRAEPLRRKDLISAGPMGGHACRPCWNFGLRCGRGRLKPYQDPAQRPSEASLAAGATESPVIIAAATARARQYRLRIRRPPEAGLSVDAIDQAISLVARVPAQAERPARCCLLLADTDIRLGIRYRRAAKANAANSAGAVVRPSMLEDFVNCAIPGSAA